MLFKKITFGAVCIALPLCFTACGQKTEEILEEEITMEDIWEDDLIEVEGEDLAMLENEEELLEDDEMFALSDEELEELEIDIDEELESIDMSAEEEEVIESAEYEIDEKGTYTSKEEVATYLHIYGKLPSNYITRSEAETLGLNRNGDNLEEIAPGKSIGGEEYSNENGMFPVEEGRQYYACEIEDEDGDAKYLIYSNDGLIFYTDENYETFIQLY